MASGDQIDKDAFLLLDGVTATGDGVWVDTKRFKVSSIHVFGITTATVQVRGSNARTKPANNVDAIQIGANITADGIVSIAYPLRWIKCKVSAYTSGTVSAVLQG